MIRISGAQNIWIGILLVSLRILCILYNFRRSCQMLGFSMVK